MTKETAYKDITLLLTLRDHWKIGFLGSFLAGLVSFLLLTTPFSSSSSSSSFPSLATFDQLKSVTTLTDDQLDSFSNYLRHAGSFFFFLLHVILLLQRQLFCFQTEHLYPSCSIQALPSGTTTNLYL